MGFTTTANDGDSESTVLLTTTSTSPTTTAAAPIPKDKFHLAYIIYFTLGCGYLLPWNAFITAVDYFTYLYPDASVDRIFAVVYMVIGLICLVVIILYSNKSHVFVRINAGLGLFVVALLIVPLLDVFYLRGQIELHDEFYVTVGAMGLYGLASVGLGWCHWRRR